MDAVLLAAVAREWQGTLRGARVDRAFSPDAHRVDLALRAGGRDARLVFSLRPGEARCHPAVDAPPNPPAPTGFCMFLRRHLVGSRILAVRAVPAERHLQIDLRSENEIGVEDARTLHFEAFGARPNLILVDGRGRVMDAFRRVSAAGEGGRPILPGLGYALPAPGAKGDPYALGPDGLLALLEDSAPADRLADLLVRRVRAVAPVWAREILATAGLEGDAAGRDVAAARERLRGALGAFLALLGGDAPRPCVAYGPDGGPLGAFPTVPQQFAPLGAVRDCATVGQAVATYHAERDRVAGLEHRRAALLKSLDKRRGRLAQKLARQDQEWREADADLALRHQGELILAHLHAIPAGAREVEVDDWLGTAPGARARLALDPERSAAENAARLFARYHKARRRHDALGGEMARARRELEYMDGVADALRRAEEGDVLDALSREVESAGVLGPPPGVGRPVARRPGRAAGRAAGRPSQAARRGVTRPQADARPALRPLAYRTPGGFTVQVGRTGYENDRLALHAAGPADLWFHVAHGPGAHAVLRLGDRPADVRPAAEDMAAAAMLAAYHSPARSSAHVEVDHCRCAHLRKAPGARPGLVLYDREGSLSVTPDARAVEAMRQAAVAAAPPAP